MTAKPYLSIEGVTVDFRTKQGLFTALTDVDLRIAEGEFVTLIGHSGCGKSTLLNVVAGLVRPSRGVVLLENEPIERPGPDRAVIFQDHSLLPWLSVLDNVLLAVNKTMAGASRTARRDWAMHNLELVHMAHAAAKKPAELSGGMKQRVGIARAIAMKPRLLLMDEPFGALDALTRGSLQTAVLELQEQLRNTVLMITHDVDEAVLLSDRVVMLTNGPAATVGEDLAVSLPRPRSAIESARLPEYQEARSAVMYFLNQRFSKPMELAA